MLASPLNFTNSGADSMVREIVVRGNVLEVGAETFRCAVGRTGISTNKKEGDGTTPAGSFPFREVFYRADRLAMPQSHLPVRKLAKTDGWCDDPNDVNYNRLVSLPYAASHEELWRQDDVYDVIVVIGYNDRPVHPQAGSAIFIHVVEEGYIPTSGCIALSLADLLRVLPHLSLESTIRIEAII
jgi:L,D-peptidoglycan transpeptidase YkuD (ErfK/YbiS/YcfS/YnhG family)